MYNDRSVKLAPILGSVFNFPFFLSRLLVRKLSGYNLIEKKERGIILCNNIRLLGPLKCRNKNYNSNKIIISSNNNNRNLQYQSQNIEINVVTKKN